MAGTPRRPGALPRVPAMLHVRAQVQGHRGTGVGQGTGAQHEGCEVDRQRTVVGWVLLLSIVVLAVLLLLAWPMTR